MIFLFFFRFFPVHTCRVLAKPFFYLVFSYCRAGTVFFFRVFLKICACLININNKGSLRITFFFDQIERRLRDISKQFHERDYHTIPYPYQTEQRMGRHLNNAGRTYLSGDMQLWTLNFIARTGLELIDKIIYFDNNKNIKS